MITQSPFGIYMKRMKSLSWRDIWTLMFIVILFIIAKIWKEPKCSSRSGRMKKMWCLSVYLYIYLSNGILLSPEKKKEILPFEGQHGWTNKFIMLNKSERKPNTTSYMWIEQPGPHRNREQDDNFHGFKVGVNGGGYWSKTVNVDL